MVDTSIKYRNFIEHLKVSAEDYFHKLKNYSEKRGGGA